MPNTAAPHTSKPYWSFGAKYFNYENPFSVPTNTQNHSHTGARPRTKANKVIGKSEQKKDMPTPPNIDIIDLSSERSNVVTQDSTRRKYGNLGAQPNSLQHNNQKPSFKYQSGRASDPKRSLAGNQNHFTNNKCLVIKGISKDLNLDQIKKNINFIAGRNIGYLFKPIILSKATQNKRTIVFELNEVDYATLSNPNIWDNSIKIAEFVGTRFWRKNNVKSTPRQKSRSVRDSWY